MASSAWDATVTTGSTASTSGAAQAPFGTQPQQAMILDFFFPGFSVMSGALQRYLKVDLNLYIPLLVSAGALTFAWRYVSEYFWEQLENHFMSTVDIRTDDEIYNMLMSWVAAQRFAQGARRFVVNTNLNSRSWFLFRWEDDDDEVEGDYSGDESHSAASSSQKQKKALSYTPTFGSHYFFYKGRLLIFRRSQNKQQQGYMVASEREEISVSCFGRNPWVLKELLLEARLSFMQKDEAKTLIYRGTTRAGTTEPSWQRCMARTSRPFSTVILNDKVKKDVIADVTDYLDPATRRWYSNRGIPYRRGYLLYGPPGTGKSSLSLALAGFFKMRIYMVSLNSVNSSEENLASLFAELPRRCVVLLEDIDTAGLTHTREENSSTSKDGAGDDNQMTPGQITPGNNSASAPTASARLSLSGLLNILDGVASQEGRVLIMTTNHLEKLDKALIRPGRVDMIVEFALADHDMIAAIFRAIFAPLEDDDVPPPKAACHNQEDAAVTLQRLAEDKAKRDEVTAKIAVIAEDFANRIPAHEFSPAELQGFLLKHKRDPEVALAGAEEWVVETRKEKKEKQIKEAEEKRKEEEKKKKKKEEEESKKKKEKEEEEKEKKKAAVEEEKKRSKKARKKAKKGVSDTDSSSSDSSESEMERKKSKKDQKEKVQAAAVDTKAELNGTVEVPKAVITKEVTSHGVQCSA